MCVALTLTGFPVVMPVMLHSWTSAKVSGRAPPTRPAAKRRGPWAMGALVSVKSTCFANGLLQNVNGHLRHRQRKYNTRAHHPLKKV